MIYYDTLNDRVATKVAKWCKENGFNYEIECKDKERSTIMYPFNIEAPAELKEKLENDLEEALK